LQSQGQCQTLLNQVHFGMNPQEAGDAARWQARQRPPHSPAARQPRVPAPR
jgi:gamma-glutamyltranspeptidase